MNTTNTSGQRVALVTGAARGIGHAIARHLLEQGIRVILVDRLTQVNEVAAALAANGLAAEAQVCDTADLAAIEKLRTLVTETHGRLDILVNYAGISPKHDGGKLLTSETSLEEFREVVRVNLTGPFLMCRAFVPLMKLGGWGRIVSISSLAGRTGSRYTSTCYAASKAGVVQLSKVLAEEVGRDGITVNCVAPGRIDTPMSNESGGEIQREYAAKIPVGRLGVPEDIAAAVAFLSSEGAGNITGATFDVNGGVYTP